VNAKKADRTKSCDRKDALQFLSRAEGHLEAIELLESDLPDSAANLAVSVAINASDAACCARLGKHSQGADHRAAVELLKSISPDGPEMANDLRRILAKKYDAEYRQTGLSATDARKIIEWARRLVANSRVAVERD